MTEQEATMTETDECAWCNSYKRAKGMGYSDDAAYWYATAREGSRYATREFA